jgi:ElaB/YqjD/DUF883 family membrane-anchored ribosome-binding protein
MKKEHFKLLLIDLYTAYNQDHLQYIDDLVERYSNGLEHDAIDTIFLKYNRKTASHYDPQKSTDEYRLQLIKDYSEGKRTLQGWIANDIQEDKTAELQKKIEEENQKVKQNLDSLKDQFSEREKQIVDFYEKKIGEITNQIQNIKPIEKTITQTVHQNSSIRISTNYTESKLILPNKETLACLGIGTMLVVKSEAGKTIGLKIKDIIYDCVSDANGKPIIEIILDKE